MFETDERIGMTLRDWFAGQVAASFRFTEQLPGMGDQEKWRQEAIDRGARFAYDMADALLKAREAVK
jgi:hypothetical protein